MYRHAFRSLVARTARLLPAALLAVGMSACAADVVTGSGRNYEDPCQFGGITLIFDQVELEVGQQQDLHAFVNDASCVGGAGLIWESSDPAVATVEEFGLLQARGVGYARISARAGEAEAYIHVMVREAGAAGDGGEAEIQPVSELLQKPRAGRHTRKRELLTWR